jgi:hypothetical protein
MTNDRRNNPQPRRSTAPRELAQALMNDVLRTKIGRSQRDALRVELKAAVPARLPKGMTLAALIEIFSLSHWFKHYKRTREFWVHLDGKEERVTCLDIRPADRCMVVLDRNKARREIIFDTSESVAQVEDDDGRRLRRLLQAVEKLDAHLVALDARQENLQKQMEVTGFKIQKVRKTRDRLRTGVEELTSLFDDQRNSYKKAIGPVTPEDLA